MKIIAASPGFSAPMDEAELKSFLSLQKLNLHLGTVDVKGNPNIHPTWFHYDQSTDRIYVMTAKDSHKVQNLRGNGLIYFCIDTPDPPYKGAKGRGRVRVSENPAENLPLAEKITTKYLGNPEDPIAKQYLDLVRQESSVVLEIAPVFYSTWDDSKSAH